MRLWGAGPRIPRKVIAPMQWRIWKKALALDPHNSNNDKWNSLLKVNRYWLAIQQGDAALKANNPDRAERLFQQARNVDNTDSYAVLGWAMWRWRAKIIPPPNAITSRPLRMDSGNTNAVRGLANIYRQQSPEKPKRISPRSASQRRSIDDIERSLQNDRLAQQAEALENREMGAGGSTSAATTGAGPRQCMDYLPTFAGSLASRTTQPCRYVNAQSGAAEAERPSRFTLTGCTSPVMIRTERRWRISTACRTRSGTAIFRSWLIDCKTIRCWKPLIACEKTVKRQKRKRCCASNRLPRVLI
ncbi:hypothetical protein DMI70_24570 [Escherichia coli]|nr:hypothetical protein [Escherichia coli]